LNKAPKYQRILLKLSGETLGGAAGQGLDIPSVERIAGEVLSVKELGLSVGVVLGGGNLMRGGSLKCDSIPRVTADNIGMLGTVVNSLALQSILEHLGCQTRVMTAVDMPKLAEPYIRRRALRHLDKGRVVIMAAGTGNPYFSTDTAAALRAVEIGAQAIFKGTKVDGVYDCDPLKNQAAKRYDSLSYDKVLADQLKVMDATAVSLCRENCMPIVVFNLNHPGTLKKIILGENLGTIVKE
jgi:uridylate kinase